jgi:hypothetical protein
MLAELSPLQYNFEILLFIRAFMVNVALSLHAVTTMDLNQLLE